MKNILIIGILCVVAPSLYADQFDTHRERVLALGNLTTVPDVMDAPKYSPEGNLKAIYFDALPWMGKPTKVFGWLGLPENREGKVPGVVLVHGGGGTAFKDWVKRWNARGFAAISIAVEGQIDSREANAGAERVGWKSHRWAGPRRVGIYGDSDRPLKDQWMYHAVADTILANSLLRSLPQVDANKVGLMGISWGGVITSTVVGIDNRFAFAIPTYGCGHLSDAQNQYGRSLGNNPLYKNVWDPMQRLGRAQMPMLWLSWPQDEHFPLDCQAACYRAAGGLQMVTLIPGLRHGHGPPWTVPDGYTFAEGVVENGSPWCRQISSAVSDDTCRVVFSSDKPFDKAVLISTTDIGFTGARNWIESPAELTKEDNQWSVVAKLPAKTTAWFVNLKSDALVVSSEYHEVDRESRPTSVSTTRRQPDTMWTYKQAAGKNLHMSVFLPDDYEEGQSFPTFVVFHGGSWREGEPSWHYPDCAYWSSRGMVAVSVEYRLKDRDSVDVPLECVKDAKSAIRFLRKKSATLKLNPDKIVAAGGSAGGQLAAATAMITSDDTSDDSDDLSISCTPNAVILWNPYFKCESRLSPPDHVAGGLPPFQTFLGDQDPAISVESLLGFHESLVKAGNASEYYVGNGGKHGFCNGRNKRNPYFYWSLELEDRFLVKHGFLSGPSKVSRPSDVAPIPEDGFVAHVSNDNANQQSRLFALLDKDKNGQITKGEYLEYYKATFDRKDHDQDGLLTAEEFPFSAALKFGDTDGDGKLAREEYPAIFEGQFDALDKNQDGAITEDEMQ